MTLAGGVLNVLGVGFLAANLRLGFEYVRYMRRRKGALLTWPGPPPPYFGTKLAIGIVIGALAAYKTLMLRVPAFGEGMMFVYYGYLIPITRRIARGFYADGIWADTRFVPYNQVGGISWREGEHSATLFVITRVRNIAQKLAVPGEHYAAARRLLRDKIGAHEIHFSGTGLDLGDRDEREEA